MTRIESCRYVINQILIIEYITDDGDLRFLGFQFVPVKEWVQFHRPRNFTITIISVPRRFPRLICWTDSYVPTRFSVFKEDSLRKTIISEKISKNDFFLKFMSWYILRNLWKNLNIVLILIKNWLSVSRIHFSGTWYLKHLWKIHENFSVAL